MAIAPFLSTLEGEDCGQTLQCLVCSGTRHSIPGSIPARLRMENYGCLSVSRDKTRGRNWARDWLEIEVEQNQKGWQKAFTTER